MRERKASEGKKRGTKGKEGAKSGGARDSDRTGQSHVSVLTHNGKMQQGRKQKKAEHRKRGLPLAGFYSAFLCTKAAERAERRTIGL